VYTNVTTYDELSGTNVTTTYADNKYTYPSGKPWDKNAINSTTPWDNSIEADNLVRALITTASVCVCMQCGTFLFCDLIFVSSFVPWAFPFVVFVVSCSLQPSNYIDTLVNGGFVMPNSTLFTKLRQYPQCYGGVPAYNPLVDGQVPPEGMSSNCLQQIDIKTHGGKEGYSGKFFCEGPDDIRVGASYDLVKGKTSPPICIVYGGGNRLNKMRFYPKVDQFALLTIQDSFNSTTGYQQLGHLGTTFQLELNGIQSPYRHRYGVATEFSCLEDPTNPSAPCVGQNAATCLVVPFHTIVIRVDQGVIQEIKWDDDDSLCDNDHSVDGNCGIDINTCHASESYGKENTATSTDCDFKIYVSWSGTDKEGTFLSSSQRRLSQFRQWSLSAVYNQASNFNTGDLPTIPTSEE
jgi:hypothetical protein